MPREATQTERERLGDDDSGEMADYESIVVSPEGRMIPASLSMSAKKNSRDNSHPLQSVALVNEIMQSHHQQQQQVSKDADGGSPVLKPVLRKQYSNSSIHSSGSAGGIAKGPPPPYKQPPPPPTGSSVSYSGASNVSPGSSLNMKSSPSHEPSSSNATYANVQIRHPSKLARFVLLIFSFISRYFLQQHNLFATCFLLLNSSWHF